LIIEIRRIKRGFAVSNLAMSSSAGFVILFFIGLVVFSTGESAKLLSAFSMICKFHVLLTCTTDVKNLIGITTAIGCASIYGMLTVNLATSKVTTFSHSDQITKFTALNNSLKFFLSSASILIMFSVVTTGFIQQALENVLSIKGFEVFPSEYIYAYGLVFTVFLGAVYLPIAQHLRSEGRRMLMRFESQQQSEQQKEMVEKLDIKESGLKNMQVILSILSPILGSIFSEVIKGLA